MTQTFKVGDKVRWEYITPDDGVVTGANSEVVTVLWSSDGAEMDHPITEEDYPRIVLVESKEKIVEFKMGDRVKATAKENADTAEFTVTGMDVAGPESKDFYFFRADWNFEKIASPPPAEPKNVGAVVKVSDPIDNTFYVRVGAHDFSWYNDRGEEAVHWDDVIEGGFPVEILSEGVEL